METLFEYLERCLGLLDKYGTNAVIVVLVIIGAVKLFRYVATKGPLIVDAHLNFLTTAAESSAKQAETLQAHAAASAAHFDLLGGFVADSLKDKESESRRWHHACDIIEEVGEKLDIKEKIERPVSAIRRELSSVTDGGDS